MLLFAKGVTDALFNIILLLVNEENLPIHFFARFKFRKLHTNVFKSAAILPRNGQFVLMTPINDKTVRQSIDLVNVMLLHAARSIPNGDF